MALTFDTTYHLSEGTSYEDQQIVTISCDSEHEQQAQEALAQGAPVLTEFVQQGLQEGWLIILT
jgi:hypothetical protein